MPLMIARTKTSTKIGISPRVPWSPSIFYEEFSVSEIISTNYKDQLSFFGFARNNSFYMSLKSTYPSLIVARGIASRVNY